MQYIYDKITPDMKPLKTAVVHPVNVYSIKGAFEAAAANLIIPVLVGPEHKIKQAAADAGVDITNFEIVPTEHSHEAADMAVELVKTGKVEALMKGKLETDEFLAPIVREKSLRTEYYMSHVFVIDGPAYPRPLYLTDCAVNDKLDRNGNDVEDQKRIHTKKSIIQNAVDLFWTLEGHAPKVAIQAATEKIIPGQIATTDAAILTGMSRRKQIKGAIVDGPLAFDNAISKQSADLKEIVSDVAGNADIVAFPSIEAGNGIYKNIIYLPDGTHNPAVKQAGIVVGARVPIILTSRADGPEERKASAALALLNARLPHRAP